MTKQEWKTKYRIWRSAVSSINRYKVNKGLPEAEQKAVWDIFWDGVYMCMPKDVYQVFMDRCKIPYNVTHWDLNNVSSIRCNISRLPNSYPRPTKNPGWIN